MIKDLKYEVYGVRGETGVRVSYGLKDQVQPLMEKVAYTYSEDGSGKVQRFDSVGRLIHAVLVGSRQEGEDAVIALVNDRAKELGLNETPIDVQDLTAKLN